MDAYRAAREIARLVRETKIRASELRRVKPETAREVIRLAGKLRAMLWRLPRGQRGPGPSRAALALAADVGVGVGVEVEVEVGGQVGVQVGRRPLC